MMGGTSKDDDLRGLDDLERLEEIGDAEELSDDKEAEEDEEVKEGGINPDSGSLFDLADDNSYDDD